MKKKMQLLMLKQFLEEDTRRNKFLTLPEIQPSNPRFSFSIVAFKAFCRGFSNGDSLKCFSYITSSDFMITLPPNLTFSYLSVLVNVSNIKFSKG